MNKRKQTALNAIKQILHNAGLRITPQRVVIYSAVLKCANHPCAEKIYKAISLENPNISFDTVNRTLISFAERGIFNIVEGYHTAKCYDHNTVEHNHYRCVKCGEIFDCWFKPYNKLATPDDIPENFAVKRKKVIIEGVCGKCKKIYS